MGINNTIDSCILLLLNQNKNRSHSRIQAELYFLSRLLKEDFKHIITYYGIYSYLVEERLKELKNNSLINIEFLIELNKSQKKEQITISQKGREVLSNNRELSNILIKQKINKLPKVIGKKEEIILPIIDSIGILLESLNNKMVINNYLRVMGWYMKVDEINKYCKSVAKMNLAYKPRNKVLEEWKT